MAHPVQDSTLRKLLADLHILYSLFHGRDLSLSTLQPRAVPHIPCFWCLPRTQTALVIKTFTPNFWVAADSSTLLAFFSDVMTEVRKHLFTNSDGPIPGGEFFFNEDGLHWFVMNYNNHQITWGVMRAAVEALTNFMVLYGFGPAEFMIMDGMNIVARGLFR